MRTTSKKPGKQRKYEYNISKHEAHKILSAPLSKALREQKGFRSLPVRVGDEVLVVRGDNKGKSGKVSKTDPRASRVFIDGLVNKKTDASEIQVPIHASNVIITKYTERDPERAIAINRRISKDEEKIDIESVLAAAEAEEDEDLIEFDDEEFEDFDDELLDDELLDDEFSLIEEEPEEDIEVDDDLDEDEEEQQ